MSPLYYLKFKGTILKLFCRKVKLKILRFGIKAINCRVFGVPDGFENKQHKNTIND